MDLTTTILTSFATSVATNGAKAPLQSLDNLWYMTFGYKVEYLAEIKRAKNEVNISQYKESISKKVDAIPEENLQEPPMSIVGPALEASKYYIEEEELREMFANVIAASMDSSKSENVHHSFVEIIKQLSPRDASNIDFIKDNPVHPIVRYSLKNTGATGSSLVKPLVFSKDLITGDYLEADTPSIYNLGRLGLISFSFDEQLTDDSAYYFQENSDDYIVFKKYFENEERSAELTKGILRLNPLGRMFTEVCL